MEPSAAPTPADAEDAFWSNEDDEADDNLDRGEDDGDDGAVTTEPEEAASSGDAVDDNAPNAPAADRPHASG